MDRSPAALVLVLVLLLGGLGCDVVTDVGSTCASGECTASLLCSEASQQLPERCASDGTCGEVEILEDQEACFDCGETMAQLKIEMSDIAQCACVYCAAQVRGCFASAAAGERFGDAERDILCQAVVECGWASHCAGSDCYCGEGVGRDDCLTEANDPNIGARGPCAEVIEAAAGCTDAELPGNCTFANQLEQNSVLARATDVAKCVTGDPLVQGQAVEPKCTLEQIDQLMGR